MDRPQKARPQLDQVVLQLGGPEGPLTLLQIDGDRYAIPNDRSRRIIKLDQYFVWPGLADCHAHLAADSLREVDRSTELGAVRKRAFAQLQKGVFLIIDKGWRDSTVLRLVDDPRTDRPEIFGAGRIISGPDGYFPGFAVETDEGGLAAAVAAADLSGGWVKLIGDWPQKGRGPVINFFEEALQAAVAVAHQAGARVAIHTMAPQTPGMAVRAGVDSIEHGLYLTLDDIASLGRRGGAWVPTIGNTESVIEFLGPGSSGARILGLGLENLRRKLAPAIEAGVAVLGGTDLGLSHGDIAAEATLLGAHGLGGDQAVAAVTTAAYRYTDTPFLTSGASADLVVFDEDPRQNLGVLSAPVAAIRAGQVIFDRIGLFAR